MGQKKDVKLEDIAYELGVSIVSVSNALKGKKGVGEKLRRKILDKAEEMGYTITLDAEKKKEATYRIGVIIAERYVKEYPSFYMDIYKEIAQAVTRQGSFVVLEIVDMEKEKLNYSFSFFRDAKVQGIILVGEMNPGFIKRVKLQNSVPIVCVDFYSVEQNMDYIVTDSFRGMEAVTQRLIDAGHDDIGFIGTPGATNSIMDRYMGYCKAMAVNGKEEKPDRVIFDRNEDGYDYWINFELPKNLPTAFVCNCDKTAFCLIDKLKERGIRVPEDISVVGFDHSYTDVNNTLELCTYENDEKAMAQISVNTLIKRINGKGMPEGVRIVEGRVVEGNTVKERKEG